MIIPPAFASVSDPSLPDVIDLELLVRNLISISVVLAAMLLTILLFWAGIRFILSTGDAKKLAEVRQLIIWAIVGFIFLGLAYLVLIIIQDLTGVPVTNFCLGFGGRCW